MKYRPYTPKESHEFFEDLAVLSVIVTGAVLCIHILATYFVTHL